MKLVNKSSSKRKKMKKAESMTLDKPESTNTEDVDFAFSEINQ
jgi:hypothetical protein